VKINLKDAIIKMTVMDGVQHKCIFPKDKLGNSFGETFVPNLFAIILIS
jgi:hypothetical protein